MNLNDFNRELLAIGGRHPNGMPRLRCVSAVSEMKFACGGMKIKYVAASKTEERWLWGLKSKTSGQITAKSEQDVRDNIDPDLFAVRKFLGRKVTWIGHPNYVIEYWAEPKDTALGWFQNRYAWWKNPETRLIEWTDINGDFPLGGRYDHLLTVKRDDGTVWGKFKEPDEADLNEVRRAIAAHEAFKKVNTDEELIQQMVDAQDAREARLEAEIAENVEQEIGPDWRRAIKNNPRIFTPGESAISITRETT